MCTQELGYYKANWNLSSCEGGGGLSAGKP